MNKRRIGADAVFVAGPSRGARRPLGKRQAGASLRGTEAFFARVVDFARRHRILVVHDAAYAALVYGR